MSTLERLRVSSAAASQLERTRRMTSIVGRGGDGHRDGRHAPRAMAQLSEVAERSEQA